MGLHVVFPYKILEKNQHCGLNIIKSNWNVFFDFDQAPLQ